jgi:hypothetical protein
VQVVPLLETLPQVLSCKFNKIIITAFFLFPADSITSRRYHSWEQVVMKRALTWRAAQLWEHNDILLGQTPKEAHKVV